MTIPGKLTVGKDGRVTGPADITWNDPFPTASGTPGGGASTMNGVVMHTEVGYEHNVIDEFNNIKFQASAFFSIGDDGHIHQYGPVGANWMAWAQVDGNPNWYSIEHEDHGHPEIPLTAKQITASAQVVECLSAFAGFPLQEANTPEEFGYGVHYMGGPAWGGHTCPDTGPDHPVRSLQRPDILTLAREIRAAEHRLPAGRYSADGVLSLADLAVQQGCTPADIWFCTASHRMTPGPLERRYLNAGAWTVSMPQGMILWLP